MDFEIFKQIKKVLNKPLINSKLKESKHLIFFKYTSDAYYRYSIDLLETLCNKTKYENKKLLFHTSLNFLLKILYNCGNYPCLNNYDLLILCSFSLGIKSTQNQQKSPSLHKLKRIYSEKYSHYENEDIKIGEIISLKLLKYNINILTSYECLFHLLKKNNKNLYLINLCIQELDNLIFQGAQKYVYKKPMDIAKESIEKAMFRETKRNNIISLNDKKIYHNSIDHFIFNNIYKKNLDLQNILPNNESISTNASSAANNSNYANNSEKNLFYSLKSNSNIKNRLKDINTSHGKSLSNNLETSNKKLKIDITYNNINKSSTATPKNRYYYTYNNTEYNQNSKKKKKYLYSKVMNLKNINNEYINGCDLLKNNNNNYKLKKSENSKNISSQSVFIKPVKVYKKNIKLQSGKKQKINKINISSPDNGDKNNNFVNNRINRNNMNNSNLINNKIIHGSINNNFNFNYEKLNDLCHKINLDILNNKNELEI